MKIIKTIALISIIFFSACSHEAEDRAIRLENMQLESQIEKLQKEILPYTDEAIDFRIQQVNKSELPPSLKKVETAKLNIERVMHEIDVKTGMPKLVEFKQQLEKNNAILESHK